MAAVSASQIHARRIRAAHAMVSNETPRWNNSNIYAGEAIGATRMATSGAAPAGDLTVALVAFPALRLGLGIALLVLRGAAPDIVAFLELAFLVAPDVALVGSGIDQFTRHYSSFLVGPVDRACCGCIRRRTVGMKHRPSLAMEPR
jgi:hypothetical protein